MTFGRRFPRRPASRFLSGPGFWGLMTAFLLLIAAGCGGGGSSNNGGGGGTQNATITGRVVDKYSNPVNQPIAGAVITYGSQTAVADQTGFFTLSVPPTTSTVNLRVSGPTNNAIYDEGLISGTRYAIVSTGYPIPGLGEAQNFGVGEIGVYSQSGPPRPPIF